MVLNGTKPPVPSVKGSSGRKFFGKMGMEQKSERVPGDFLPVSGCIPEWIDISVVCKDAKRFVGLYAVGNFDMVAINSGQSVYTTADRNGEFRRNLQRVSRQLGTVDASHEQKAPTVIHDCVDRREWLAPRDSAVRFLYQQQD